MGPLHTAIFLVHESVVAHFAIPAGRIFAIELENQVNGGVLQFPTCRAKWRPIALLVIERFVERHLLAKLERLFEAFVVGVELSILLNEVHNAAIKIEHPAIKFDVLDLVDGIGDFFCVVENSHADNCRT